MSFPSDVEYAEVGSGPAVLLLPGSFGTGAGWKLVVDALGPRYRFVTTSLLGYGKTAERRPLGNATTAQQTEVLDLIMARMAAPVHVVAHSYGGLSALAHAIEGKTRVASLTLVEANPLGVLRTAGETVHYAMFEELIARYFAAFEHGDPDAARHVIDFYGGPGTFDAFPDKVRGYVRATTPSNIRDWTSGTPFAPPLPAFQSISGPVAVIRGGDGHPAMQRLGEVLASAIQGATFHTGDGGSHFLPTSHPKDIAAIVEATIARVSA
jgi:pimeloyl-ACP methyl ester carboxylesterase